MNIESLSYLSSALMHAHRDTAYALGRLVGGTADKCGVARDVMSAISRVDKAMAEFLASGFGAELHLDVEIEINTNKVPAKVWFAIDVDGPHLFSVVAGGMDVMALISKEDIDEYKAEFISECAKRKTEAEADDAFEYEA